MKKYELGRVRPEDTDDMEKVPKKLKMEEEFSINQLVRSSRNLSGFTTQHMKL